MTDLIRPILIGEIPHCDDPNDKACAQDLDTLSLMDANQDQEVTPEEFGKFYNLSGSSSSHRLVFEQFRLGIFGRRVDRQFSSADDRLNLVQWRLSNIPNSKCRGDGYFKVAPQPKLHYIENTKHGMNRWIKIGN